MEIITGTKASKFVYEDWANKHGISSTATAKEKDIWWGNEMEYWIEGRLGLSGIHYFALTQCMIKDARGFRKRPIWRDVDELIYEAYNEARRTNHDLFVSKRREIGLSLVFGGVAPMWIALTNPGSTSLITSADKTRLENLYKEKTRVIYDNLDPYIKPDVISTRQSGYLHMGIKDQKTGEIQGLDSQIITRETVDTPTALEAYRGMHCFLDEAFLHPKADQVYKSAQASVKSGFVKVAPIVIGGSAGESTSIGQKLANNLWKNAENLNLLTVFLPGNMGIMEAPELDDNGKETGKILNFCPNGHSNIEAATEWINKTREKLDKIEDKSFLNSFIKQYPLEINEVFSSSSYGALPEDVISKLNQQEKILLTSPPPIEKCQVYKDYEGTLQVSPTSTGKFVLLERVNPNHTYLAGMDPIPFVSNKLGDGSENCIVIKDLDTNKYVAYYKERDANPDLIMSNNINLQDYFNKAKVMIEVNRGGVILDTYRTSGRQDLLAPSPRNLGKTFFSKERNWGWYKNDHTAERANAYLIEYLRKNFESVYFKEMIDEAKVYIVENTDILDAVVSCEIYHKDLMEKLKKKEDEKPMVKKIPMIEYINGRAVRVWKEVRIAKA
jgi:hypothetical protein